MSARLLNHDSPPPTSAKDACLRGEHGLRQVVLREAFLLGKKPPGGRAGGTAFAPGAGRSAYSAASRGALTGVSERAPREAADCQSPRPPGGARNAATSCGHGR